MILTPSLKRVGDISFYMTFTTAIAWIINAGREPGLIITLPIFMVTAFLATFLAQKWGNARFLAILPLLTVFLVVPLTTVNLIVLLPAVFLMIHQLPKPNERGSKVEYQRKFQLFITLFVILVIFFVIVTIATMAGGIWSMYVEQIWINFSNEVLIFGLTFLVSSVIYMRMIRHDKDILRQPRFRIMNLYPIILLGVAALVVSHPWTLQLVSSFIFGILFLLWRGVAWIFPWLGNAVALPLREIDFNRESSILDAEETIGNEAGELRDICPPEINCEMFYFSYDVFNPFPLIVGTTLIIGFILLYRALIKKHANILEFEEERSFLDNKKPSRRRNRQENQIRAVYLKFLKLLQRQKIEMPISTTSSDVEVLASTMANREMISDFREEYIRVRYGEANYTPEDLARVKGLYKKIKTELEQ